MQHYAGREFLKWLQKQACNAPEWQAATDRRNERITQCFQVFDAYVASHKKE